MAPLIEIKNLSLTYDAGTARETHALRDVSLSVYPKEYVIFFGPSGCGKSTLLYCVAGLLTPSSGSIVVSGSDISLLSPGAMADYHRKKIGIVFQAYNLIPTLSILDNVALPQTWRGAPKSYRDASAFSILKKFNLDAVAKRLPQELSGGQQQRVAVARSLMNDPPLILGDEPVGNLDSKAAKTVLEVFSRLNAQEKKAIILVTHDPSLFPYADRVIFMQDGKIVKEELNSQKIKAGPDVGAEADNLKAGQIKELTDALSDSLLFVSEMHLKDKIDALMESYFAGRISLGDLTVQSVTPFRNGGLGFSRERAKKFLQKLDQILFESEMLKNKTAKDLRYFSLHKEIGSLRKYLLADFAVPLSFLQIQRLEEAIEMFVRGVTDEKGFTKIIILPEIAGGIGLSDFAALQFLYKLKIVFALR